MVDERRAAVLGSPVSHSRSPQLHGAAFAAHGLDGWRYDRIECGADELPGLVRAAGPEWVGFSVTMPGKAAALAVADVRTRRAELVGSANTLVRCPEGWLADNTDVEGVTGALGVLGCDIGGRTVLLLGAGGTALAVVVALARAGAGRVLVASRSRERSRDVLDCAARAGLDAEWIGLDADRIRAAVPGVGLVVNALPIAGAEGLADAVSAAPHLLDVLYEPWPTPMVAAVSARGGRAVGGLAMLLFQAYEQSRHFTGRPAPRAEMAAAIGLAEDGSPLH